jgi:hypothetical protein
MAHDPRSGSLDAARSLLGLSVLELWFDYMGLGGNLTPVELQATLTRGEQLDDREHDVLAQALNERFVEQDENHPVAYADELPGRN